MEATAVAILGVIAGFIAAFFAEPVKTHFENSAKRKNLKTALYKELIDNYEFLVGYGTEISESGLKAKDPIEFYRLVRDSSPYMFRMDVYEHALSDSWSIFYQLQEASTFKMTYYYLKAAIDFADELDKGQTTSSSRVSIESVQDAGKRFMEAVETSFYANGFKKKMLKRLAYPALYDIILGNGKIVSQRDKREREAKNRDIMERVQKHSDNSGEAPQTRNPEDTDS